VVFTSTIAGSTPDAMADESDGPPEAVELEPDEPAEPDGRLPEPNGEVPEPNGEVPEPDEGRVVVGSDEVPELERQATLPTPNPAAMAKTTTSATTVTTHARRALRCAAGSTGGGGAPTQYGPGG
jgi:hypothetical protein